MELILIELLLWAGLILFFWTLRDSLTHIETEAESQGAKTSLNSAVESRAKFDRADKVSELIGRYGDSSIYRYAIIGGDTYQFNYILPFESFSSLQAEERCLAPGLVYTRCGDTKLTPARR